MLSNAVPPAVGVATSIRNAIMSPSATDSVVCAADPVSTLPARTRSPIHPSRLLLALAMLLAVTMVATAPSIASAQGQPAHSVAPSDETVTATTMLLEKFGGSPYKEIRVQNASTVPIVVTSVTLLSCVNIRQDCNEPAALNVHVAPATHETIYRVEPCDGEVNFSFQYTMQWHADAAAGTGETGAAAANSRAIVRLRVEPDSLVMRIGQRVTLHQQVSVTGVDAEGNAVGPVQSYTVQFATSPVAAIAGDTVVAQSAGRTTIEFHVTSMTPPLTVTLPIVVLGDTPDEP